jgi:formylglycine-generating enzyme required for sulfatase activity
MKRYHLHLLTHLSASLGLFGTLAAEIDFIQDVKPVLEFNCVSCHRADNAKGKLRLDEKEFAFKSKDVISPGDPEESSLYWTTTLPKGDDEIMPPIKNEEKDYPLRKPEQTILKQWIKEGAKWPDGIKLTPRKRLPKKITFVNDVKPILEINCLSCHRKDKAEGKLRLDTFEHAFAKEDVIVPGDPVASDLWYLCTLPMDDEELMPPKGNDPLDPADLFMLRRWIEEGAEWPEGIILQPKKKSLTVLGMLPKELYQKLGFKAGTANDGFKAYTQEIPTSDSSFDLLPIKGGTFTMGSPKEDPNRGKEEHIAHKVKVNDFWMAKHELTWDEYELWMLNLDKDNRKYKKLEPTDADELTDGVTKPTAPYTDMTFGMGKNGYPAICMTQLAAKMYSMWLSARTGRFYRLPTEAEWEYACKAGTETAYSFGEDKGELSKHSWHLGNSRFKYQKIGQKPANPWGLHDMHGNVWEWVLDQYAPPAESVLKGLTENPLVAPNTLYPRVVKGGSWDDGSAKHRSAARMGSNEAWKQQDPQIPKSVWYHTDAIFVGFRLVRPKEIPTLSDIEKFWPSEEDIKAIPSR